jgi:beta-N-acetylhexosaminidase
VCASLMGRGAMGWDSLLAEARYGEAQARLAGEPGAFA